MLIKIPRRRINITFYEIFKLLKLLLFGKFKKGKEIGKFEREFAKYLKCKYAVCTYSGKQALYIILKSLDLKKKDEILVPSYTASSVPMTIVYAGLKPVFVDVNPKTFNINPKLIESKIGKKTRAIIATHVHGLPCDMGSVSKICKKHNLILVEDCAHASGAEYKNKKMGTFGKASFFSFGAGKHLSTFGGGMVVSNDVKFIKKVRSWVENCEFPSNFALFCRFIKMIFLSLITKPIIFSLTVYPFLYIFGNNFITELFETKISLSKEMPEEYKKRFSNAQALIGLKELKSLNANLTGRIRNASILKEQLKNLKDVKIQKYPSFFKHAYLDFAVSVEDREKLMKKLLEGGVDTQKTWLDDCSGLITFGNSHSLAPFSQKLAKSVIYLPIDPCLDERKILAITKVFKSSLHNIK